MGQDDDDEPDLEALTHIANDVRKGGGFRYKSRHLRDIEECDDAANALNGLGLEYTNLSHRGRDDPPDCEAVIEGARWGIELVEFLDEQTLTVRVGSEQRPHHEWTQDEFLEELGGLITDKDNPSKLKGGPYGRYLLVVRTEEMHLTKACLEQFLVGAEFSCSMITDACVALGYHPGTSAGTPHPYPSLRIMIRRSDPVYR